MFWFWVHHQCTYVAQNIECICQYTIIHLEDVYIGFCLKIARLLEEFDDTKGAIRICISEKNRQHSGQNKKTQEDKQRSRKHTYKAKDRVTQSTLKTGGGLRCSGRVSSSCSTSDTRRVNLVTNPVISRE
jgi:hypothetical protein